MWLQLAVISHISVQIKTMNESNEGPYTKLIPDLKGVDPDDAFSTVPYEKGFALLFYLENLLGGPGEFLSSYLSIVPDIKNYTCFF